MRSDDKDMAMHNDDKPMPMAAPAMREQPMMKLFKVYPRNAQEPPFHYSSTPGVMLVAAHDADRARQMAATEAGDTAWLDDKAVCVEEYMPKSAMVVARDFKG